MADGPRPVSLAVVLGAVLLSLAAGYLLKLPCLTATWEDGRQYNRLCYSDVAALYAAADRDRGLTEDRVPYLSGANEYPVLSGLAMWVAAVPARSYVSFFNWSAVLLTGFALATAWALHRMAGPGALFFALAPSLMLYAFINWDLIAVAFATLATLAFLRGRDGPAGALLGLGTASKLYPALLLVPFALHRGLRWRRAALLVGAAAGTWLLVNLPFALAAPDRWSEFYRFSTARPPDFDSAWYLVGQHLELQWDVGIVNSLSTTLLVMGATLLTVVAIRRRDEVPVWAMAFPLLIVFLLTGKVYSPQFGLWLLPWFALVLPDRPLFVAFQVTDVLVFITRFQYFARLEDVGPGLPFWAFEIAIILRAAVLVACVVAWARRSTQAPSPVPALEAA